jgi:hypothetical protein
MNFLGVYDRGMESCFNFSPNLGTVKILSHQLETRWRRKLTNLSVLPEIPIKPSGHILAVNEEACSSVS